MLLITQMELFISEELLLPCNFVTLKKIETDEANYNDQQRCWTFKMYLIKQRKYRCGRKYTYSFPQKRVNSLYSLVAFVANISVQN